MIGASAAMLLMSVAMKREICIQNGPEQQCFASRDVTGWWMCADEPPALLGILNVGAERGGRFQAFDSNKECGALGCPRANGRFKRVEIERGSEGQVVRTIIVIDDEPADGFEPIDRFATSSCTFSRFISGGNNAEKTRQGGVGSDL